jgi:zinc protease
MGVNEFALKNGLQVLVCEDNTIPSVVAITAYRVGSRNEGAGTTGSAHLFEHLQFKGSKKFNRKLGTLGDDLMQVIGAKVNAYTSFDQTVYHTECRPEDLELVLAIAADGMTQLTFKEADRRTEMPVVRQEMDQGDNDPDEALEKLLLATAYSVHPYHHEVIGSASEVENVKIKTLRDFYKTHYYPNNATLLIFGNITTDEALSMAQRQFGRLHRSPHKIPPVYAQEPKQEGERRFEILRAGDLARIAMGFHVPAANHPDTAALHVLSHILGHGGNRSSRLYKSLVQTGLVADCGAMSPEMRDPGLFRLSAVLNDGIPLAQVEAALDEELRRLSVELVSNDELARVKTVNRKGTTLALSNTIGFAFMLARAVGFADWTYILGYDARFEAVTAGDVQRVARKYLPRSNRTVGLFIPRATEAKGDEQRNTASQEPVAQTTKFAPPRLDVLRKTIASYKGQTTLQWQAIAPRLVTTKLANGLTVNVLKEKPGKNVVAVDFRLKAGSYFQGAKKGVAGLVAELLTRGSANFTTAALGQELSELGIAHGVHVQVGAFLTGTATNVLADDLSRYLAIVNDIMRRPNFPEEELARAKVEMMSELYQMENQPGGVAANTLQNSIFGQDSVFHRKSFAELRADLQSITVADLRAFHEENYVPNGAVITIVGDIESASAKTEVETLFGDWQAKPEREIKMPAPTAQESRTIIKKMTDKPAVSIILGTAIDLKRSSTDHLPALLALQILGGHPLTSKLGRRVREELGLTYGIYAKLADNSFGWAPLMVSMSVATPNIQLALKETRAILDQFYRDGVTPDELSTQKDNACGSRQVQLASLRAVASLVGELSAQGMDLQAIDNFAAKVQAITLDEVNAAIKKYFDPAKLVTVIAGTV